MAGSLPARRASWRNERSVAKSEPNACVRQPARQPRRKWPYPERSSRNASADDRIGSGGGSVTADARHLPDQKSRCGALQIFGDPAIATALLDRLLHHAVVIQIEGSSYSPARTRGPSWPHAAARAKTLLQLHQFHRPSSVVDDPKERRRLIHLTADRRALQTGEFSGATSEENPGAIDTPFSLIDSSIWTGSEWPMGHTAS